MNESLLQFNSGGNQLFTWCNSSWLGHQSLTGCILFLIIHSFAFSSEEDCKTVFSVVQALAFSVEIFTVADPLLIAAVVLENTTTVVYYSNGFELRIIFFHW